MLDNIRLHLHDDDATQESIEADLATNFKTVFERNKRAFFTHIPSIAKNIHKYAWIEKGLFVNKNSQCNIVDKSNGVTLYGLDPDGEIKRQYHNRLIDAPGLTFTTDAAMHKLGLGADIDCLVVLGIGLGHHLSYLINHHKIKHLIIYEPDVQLFSGSLLCFDWKTFLDNCQSQKTNLYFQIEQDGSNLVTDLNELKAHFSLSNVSFYKHYNCISFNAVEREFRQHNWQFLCETGLNIAEYEQAPNELPTWTPPTSLDSWFTVIPAEHEKFTANISAFKRYFPDIAREFEHYKPTRWQPYKNKNGTINLCSVKYPESYHGEDPRREGELNYELFAKYPNRDGVVFGYQGTKLKSYTHYRFVKATESLINETEDLKSSLPTSIKSLILFGLATGYQLQQLTDNHAVENLYICEPEPDFFYASLFAIDWAAILKQADDSEHRIYINIGDNGENLFKDLMNQFYAVGPYTLVSTFFYQSYYRKDLEQSIAQLREQLQVVIAYGEYYDHARYGITHTVEAIDRGYPYLRSTPAQYLSQTSKDIPVFIVGNGPSLDNTLALIKESSERAIVISCGTALGTLYKNGIKPDFHAEIEQNRSTFDWIARVGDFDYLKDITLLSCNGIHPDTCDLFKTVLLAFKYGESSTASTLSLSNENQWSVLQFAFPTVSNLAINLCLELGFSSLYLLGIDLGFIDETKHHSSQSGYYDENGNELYNYAEKNALSYRVKGNFRPFVGTKHEFKVAKDMLEQALRDIQITCYNCSDGAFIQGTSPLKPENIILDSTAEEKRNCLEQLTSSAYKQVATKATFKDTFYAKFSQKALSLELDESIEQAKKALANTISIDAFIDQQKLLLSKSFQSNKSLLFYLLYGSSNYANSVLSKLNLVNESKEDGTTDESTRHSIDTVLNEWIRFLNNVKKEYLEFPQAFDFVSSFDEQRQAVFKRNSKTSETIYLICAESFQNKFVERFDIDKPSGYRIEIIDHANINSVPSGSTVFLMRSQNEPLSDYLEQLLSASDNLFVVFSDESIETMEEIKQQFPFHRYCFVLNTTPMYSEKDLSDMLDGNRPYTCHGTAVTYMVHSLSNMRRTQCLIPKLFFVEESAQAKEKYALKLETILSQFDYVFDYPNYVIGTNKYSSEMQTNDLGGRARSMQYYQGCVNFFLEDMPENIKDVYASHFLEGIYGNYPSYACD